MENKKENGYKPRNKKKYGDAKSSNRRDDLKPKGPRSHRVDEFDNHPSWYKTNEQLAKDTASIPFGYALGGTKSHGPYGGKFNDYSVAGIMRINYMPTYGHLDNITAPINIASRNIYTNLKSVNSRAKSYDAPDIAIYLGAIDSLISYHEWMKRIYGLMNTASITNRYYAWAAVEAAGGNYYDLLNKINDFRAYINQFALRISTLPLPAEMSVFARHAWLNAHVWYDSANPTKAQSYVFSPTGFWHYKLDEDGAGMLEYLRLNEFNSQAELGDGKAILTLESIKALGETLLSAVLYGAGDQDFNIMAGDILYAYGESKIYRATTITEDYAVIPQYDAWVCDQINNIRMFGVPTEQSNSIVQDPDKRYLVHNVEVELPSEANLGEITVRNLAYPWNDAVMDQYINIFDGDTSADHVMVATRLTAIPTVRTEGDKRYLVFNALATELVENACVYYFATETGQSAHWKLYRSPLYKTVNLMWQLDNIATDSRQSKEIGQANFGVVDMIAQLSSFDRKPLHYIDMVKVIAGTYEYDLDYVSNQYSPHAIVDLNNYSIISYTTMKQMNDTILLAMFGIDEFGKQISLS